MFCLLFISFSLLLLCHANNVNLHSLITVFKNSYGNDRSDIDMNAKYVSPETGLVFMKYMDGLALMGAGTYFKSVFNLNFKVYTVGLYVERDAYRSKSLSRYKGISSERLVQTSDFYPSIAASEDYDKSILIKMAMSVSTETLVQGLINDLKLTDEHGKVFAEITRKYRDRTCPRGLEFLFTYRASRNNQPPTMEVRVGGELFEVISDAVDISQDFFWQFVSNCPVSEQAKIRFADNFPALIDGCLAIDNDKSVMAFSNQLWSDTHQLSNNLLEPKKRVMLLASKSSTEIRARRRFGRAW